jgi:hypothetical protein
MGGKPYGMGGWENSLGIGIGDSKGRIQFPQRFFKGVFDGIYDQFSSRQTKVPSWDGEGKEGNENH